MYFFAHFCTHFCKENGKAVKQKSQIPTVPICPFYHAMRVMLYALRVHAALSLVPFLARFRLLLPLPKHPYKQNYKTLHTCTRHRWAVCLSVLALSQPSRPRTPVHLRTYNTLSSCVSVCACLHEGEKSAAAR